MIDLLNSWSSVPGDWQPRGKTSRYAAASSTRLQQNEGIYASSGRGGGAAIQCICCEFYCDHVMLCFISFGFRHKGHNF